MSGLRPGIHKISEDIYHRDPCETASVSRGTIADLINCTPAHARFYHPKLNPDYSQAEKSAFDIGTVAHALFLEGLDKCEVIDFPDWRTNNAKIVRDEARNAGKVPLLKHQYNDVRLMVESAQRQLRESDLGIKDLQMEGDSELTYIWQEDKTLCRCRPDWISHKKIGDRKLIIDLKTTSASADPNAFKASDHSKDIQYSFYRRGVKAIEGEKSPRFIFMTVETFPPYLCSFVSLDPQTVEIAKQKVEAGLWMWRQCMESGEWPGYPQRVCYAESRAYEVAAWEMKYQMLGTE